MFKVELSSYETEGVTEARVLTTVTHVPTATKFACGIVWSPASPTNVTVDLELLSSCCEAFLEAHKPSLTLRCRRCFAILWQGAYQTYRRFYLDGQYVSTSSVRIWTHWLQISGKDPLVQALYADDLDLHLKEELSKLSSTIPAIKAVEHLFLEMTRP